MLDLGGGILKLLVLLAQLVEQFVIDTDGQGDGVTIGQDAGGEVMAGVRIVQGYGGEVRAGVTIGHGAGGDVRAGVTIGHCAGTEVRAGVMVGQDVGEGWLRYHVLGVRYLT